MRFYNIDYHRPEEKEIKDYFEKHKFNVVGISAVVSTAYQYTKKLVEWIRNVSPDTRIIVGGNLAASAEILHRKCHVDYCVIGDGELTVQKLLNVLNRSSETQDQLGRIKGITFLDHDDTFVFTGFGERNPQRFLSQPDWSILEKDGSINFYVSEDIENRFYGRIPKSHTPGKRYAVIMTSKGCVNRCTFCHRWEKGYRVHPVRAVVDNVKYLQSRFNVQYVVIGDEDFGSNRKLTNDLVRGIGELGVKWRCSGVRVRAVNPDILKMWRENGCIAVFYGIESGCQKMLDVMEKKSTVETNLDALKWTCNEGLFTIIQLVIGMPGEDDQTIGETIRFLKKAIPYLDLEGKMPSALLSINYAQALPGSPLYQYARLNELIGRSIDEEERYLEGISDTDAYLSDHFVNFTRFPILKVRLWRQRILADVDAYYLKKAHGIHLTLKQIALIFLQYTRSLVTGERSRIAVFARPSMVRSGKAELMFRETTESGKEKTATSGYFNIHIPTMEFLFLNKLTQKLYYPFLAIGVARGTANSITEMIRMVGEHVVWSLRVRIFPSEKRKYQNLPSISLRKLNKETMKTQHHSPDDATIPLRMGR